VARPAGILLDFYGTLVEDDDREVATIGDIAAAASGGRVTVDQVGRAWWSHFEAGCRSATGPEFVLQRGLATRSLDQTLRDLGLELDAATLTERLWPHWQAPRAHPDAWAFLEQCPLPVCVLSDIDRADVEAAIAHTGLPLPWVVTSEDVRAYKPAPDGFHAAAARLSLPLGALWHVGDSLSSDIAGAAGLGLPSVWINRQGTGRGTAAPVPVFEISSLTELLPMLVGPS
jgi:FMN phosphatase YigB (HAD superfamily)